MRTPLNRPKRASAQRGVGDPACPTPSPDPLIWALQALASTICPANVASSSLGHTRLIDDDLKPPRGRCSLKRNETRRTMVTSWSSEPHIGDPRLTVLTLSVCRVFDRVSVMKFDHGCPAPASRARKWPRKTGGCASRKAVDPPDYRRTQ
jgi:hypothetical protein